MGRCCGLGKAAQHKQHAKESMMSNEQTKSKSECSDCPLCHKEKGLPILLTRYAMAPSEANAPVVAKAGDFSVAVDAPLGKSADYTQRLLRSGYVYQYTESNDGKREWKGYIVSEFGYLTPYKLPKATQKPALDGETGKEKPCYSAKNGIIAGCITLSNVEKMKTAWFAFSDAEWTDALLKWHENEANRKLNMRKLDVQAWLGSQKHKHAAHVKEANKHVMEFCDAVQENHYSVRNMLQFSPAPFARRTGYFDYTMAAKAAGHDEKSLGEDLYYEPGTGGPVVPQKSWGTIAQNGGAKALSSEKKIFGVSARLVREFEKLSDKGMILALDDPAGVAMDLACFMPHSLDRFIVRSGDLARKLAASEVIMGMRKSIEDEAEEDCWRTAKEAADKYVKEISMYTGGLKASQAEYDKMAIVPPEKIEQVRAEAWKKYAFFDKGNREGKPRYDQEALKAAHTEATKRIKQFDQETILPLAKAHAKWMTSKDMARYFKWNFDAEDETSGDAYLALLSACIADTQDKKPCFEVYLAWLNGQLDKDNLLLRALLFNQDKNVENVKELMQEVQDAMLKVEVNDTKDIGTSADIKRRVEDFGALPDFSAGPEGMEVKPDLSKLAKGVLTGPLKGTAKTIDQYGRLIFGTGETNNIRHDRIALFMLQIASALSKSLSSAISSTQQLGDGIRLACAITGRRVVVVRYTANSTRYAARFFHKLWAINRSLPKGQRIFKKTLTEQQVRAGLLGIIKSIKASQDFRQGSSVMQNFPIAIDRARLLELLADPKSGANFVNQAAKDNKPIAAALRFNAILREAMFSSNSTCIDQLGRAAVEDRPEIRNRVETASTGLNLGASVIGGIFAWVGLFSAGEQMSKTALPGEEYKLWAKFTTATLGVVSAMVDVFQRAIATPFYRNTRLPFAKGLSQIWESRLRRIFARGCGAAAGVISALLDLVDAAGAIGRGEYGMVALHITSAGISLAGAWLIFSPAASTGVGIILLALGVGVSWIISYFKDNPAQVFIGKCIFGLDEKRYSAQAEMQALQTLGGN
jgi:hypothetical protein